MWVNPTNQVFPIFVRKIRNKMELNGQPDKDIQRENLILNQLGYLTHSNWAN